MLENSYPEKVSYPWTKNAGQVMKWLERLLFVPRNAVTAEPSFAIACLLAALFFVATRLVVFELYTLRHYNMLQADPGDYVSAAVYITNHGRLPNDATIESRVFPGLPIVMSAVNGLVGNMVLTGYLVSWLSALGSIFLFHKIFRNFRSTLLYTTFVPSWLMTSTLIMSEGLTFLLMLTAIWAFRERALSAAASSLSAGRVPARCTVPRRVLPCAVSPSLLVA